MQKRITTKGIPPLINSTDTIVTSDIYKCEALLYHFNSVYIANPSCRYTYI